MGAHPHQPSAEVWDKRIAQIPKTVVHAQRPESNSSTWGFDMRSLEA